jgi:hypothetical protein
MPSSARGHGSQRRDPLTTIIIILVYPILFLLFAILHIFYDCFLKLIANIKWQRHIYSEVRRRPRQVLLHSWRSGLGIKVAGTYTAERASEERLLMRGNIVRTVGRLISSDKSEIAFGKLMKQKALAPRHLALVVAEKPVKTRYLIYRAFKGALLGRDDKTTRQRQEEQHDRREREQSEYAIDSAKTLLQCCAFTGVEEVSIYDEAGRIKRALSGTKEWVLEWPLYNEWKPAALDLDIQSQEQQISTPLSDSPSSSTSTTPRSNSSTLHSTPSLYKSNLHEYCDQDTASTEDPSRPRLRLTACLQRPSYDSEAFIEEPASKGYADRENIQHAKIKVNLLDSNDAKKAIAQAASWISDSPNNLKTIEVKTIDSILQGE